MADNALTPEQHEFTQVRALAEAALATVFDGKGNVKPNLLGPLQMGAINYADLSIVRVSWMVDEDNNACWVLDVEEASPDCNLGLYLSKKLEEHGIVAEVRCGW